MKRTLIFILPLLTIACSEGNDPIADAEKVCDCYNNSEAITDCTKLVAEMGEKYKYEESDQITYAKAYAECRD